MVMLIFGIMLFMAACAKQIPPPPFSEAERIENTPEVVVKEVVKPVPLPNQLKPKPLEEMPRSPEITKSHEIIDYANKHAKQDPKLEDYFNAIQVYDYVDGALYQVYAAPLRETAIMLQPGEVLRSASAGDTKRWEYHTVYAGSDDTEQPIFLIKPHQPGLQTNLLLTTNLRTYILELTAYRETFMAAVSWHYPMDRFKVLTKQVEQKKQDAAEVISPAVNLADLSFNYEISGDAVRWRPVRVFDDGAKTYIQFPQALATSEAPALFLSSRGAKTQLVNYRVKQNYYIVDKLFDAAELRIGGKQPQVVRITRVKERT